MLPALLLAAAAAKSDLPTGDVAVPFERVDSGHIVIQVAVGSAAPVPMVVDTGASVTVLTPDTWRAAGGNPDKGLKVRGRAAGGKLEDVRLAAGVDLTIGGAAIPVGAAVVMPMDLQVPGFPVIGGVLGRDVLRQYVVEVDDGTGTFTLHPAKSVLSSEGMAILPMHRVRSNLTATVATVSGQPVEAVIDLGASMTVFNAQATRVAGVTPTPCEGTAMGADGVAMTLTCLTLDRFALGDLELGPMTVTAVDLPIFKPLRLDDAPAMILGNDVYAGRRLILDDGRKQLWLSTSRVAVDIHTPGRGAPPTP